MRRGRWKNWVLLGCLLGFLGCDDVVWFVSWNAGPIQEEGLVVIIGTPREPPPESIRLISGQIPKGMAIEEDGTVQGIPEEAGHFEFSLEFSDDGIREIEDFSVDLEPG